LLLVADGRHRIGVRPNLEPNQRDVKLAVGLPLRK
jgi:hypothetical protein